jgi:hypothetical protein
MILKTPAEQVAFTLLHDRNSSLGEDWDGMTTDAEKRADFAEHLRYLHDDERSLDLEEWIRDNLGLFV